MKIVLKKCENISNLSKSIKENIVDEDIYFLMYNNNIICIFLLEKNKGYMINGIHYIENEQFGYQYCIDYILVGIADISNVIIINNSLNKKICQYLENNYRVVKKDNYYILNVKVIYSYLGELNNCDIMIYDHTINFIRYFQTMGILLSYQNKTILILQTPLIITLGDISLRDLYINIEYNDNIIYDEKFYKVNSTYKYFDSQRIVDTYYLILSNISINEKYDKTKLKRNIISLDYI